MRAAEGVDYVFGLAQNARQQRRSRSRGLASGRTSRRYRDFRYRTLASWSRKRRVWVSLSSVFPRQELFAHSLARLRAETPG